MIIANAPVEQFDELESTQMEARRRAALGDYGPVWLVAKRQTAGRGRRGRHWASLDGNLMTTYLCATLRPPGEIAQMGLAAGVAIAECLETLLGPKSQGTARVTLKWPNDVLIDAAKVAGILIDSAPASKGAQWAALGIGINLVAAPGGIDQKTTSLAQASGAALNALTFLEQLRARLLHWDETLSAEGFAPLREAWLQRAHGLGAEASVAAGEETLIGRIVGLSPRGELELETQAGLRAVAAGDLLIAQSQAV